MEEHRLLEIGIEMSVIMKKENRLLTWCITIACFLSLSLSAQDTNSLPLFEITSASEPKAMVLFVTGDGGWNSFSKSLCESLSGKGYHIVALDSRAYFWKQKSPDTLAATVARIVKAYEAKWKTGQWILTGYSFGADVASFVPGLLDKYAISLPSHTIYLAPSSSTDFEIKLSDLAGISTKVRKYDVGTEINKAIIPTLCIQGADETSKYTYVPAVATRQLPGDHHFNENFELLSREIIFFLTH